MKKTFVLIVCLLLAAAGGGRAFADWAQDFAVHEGSVYELTSEPVDAALIGSLIGTGNYRIADTEANTAIAVKTGENDFVKTKVAGDLKGRSELGDYRFWFGLAGGVLVLLLIYNFFRRK